MQDIQLSEDGTKYDVTVTYAPAGEGREENPEKKCQYDKTSWQRICYIK